MRSAPATREGVPRPQSARGVVLLLDDEPLLLKALERILRPEGHEVRLADSLEAARAQLLDPALDVVLVDLFLGNASGLDVLDLVYREGLEVEVIVMTGHASIESAVGCMRRGAFDYLAKPFEDVHRVRATVGKAIERRHLVRRNRELERELQGRAGGPELVGRSEPMRALQRKVESLRHNESNVLIQGESGTGKELVARALHTASPRSGGPFVPVDCGALPESIIESELFGHERGAFTGALGARGPVPHGPPRHAVPRRGRRDAAARCRPSCCACSRSARCGRSAGARRCRWTSGSSRPATGTSPRWWRPAPSGPISSTG